MSDIRLPLFFVRMNIRMLVLPELWLTKDVAYLFSIEIKNQDIECRVVVAGWIM
jgi:hypothetical protein